MRTGVGIGCAEVTTPMLHSQALTETTTMLTVAAGAAAAGCDSEGDEVDPGCWQMLCGYDGRSAAVGRSECSDVWTTATS